MDVDRVFCEYYCEACEAYPGHKAHEAHSKGTKILQACSYQGTNRYRQVLQTLQTEVAGCLFSVRQLSLHSTEMVDPDSGFGSVSEGKNKNKLSWPANVRGNN